VLFGGRNGLVCLFFSSRDKYCHNGGMTFAHQSILVGHHHPVGCLHTRAQELGRDLAAGCRLSTTL
jgi:hypothetical protein